MMSEAEFSRWTDRCNLTREAIALARRIRASNPSHRSHWNSYTVRCRYLSRKMGNHVEYDLSVAAAQFISQAERHSEILEYWSEIPGFKIGYEINGRRHHRQHVVDFAVFMEGDLILDECKPEKQLIRLADKIPGFFVKKDGDWHCPPVQKALAAMGIAFLVWTTDSTSFPQISQKEAQL